MERDSDDLGEIVFIHSPDEILWCNNDAAELLGYKSPIDVIGKRREDILSEKDGETVRIQSKKVIETREGGTTLVDFIKNDGSTVSCISSHGLFNEETSDVIISVVQPVDKKDLKENVDDLLKEVLHEVNTPLSVLKGYTELLNGKEDIDPETKEFLEIMMRNIERLEDASERVKKKIRFSKDR